MEYADFLKQQLGEAASVAQSFFGKVSGEVKTGDNNQVLTEADIAVGTLLVAAVQKHYPGHNVIDEEAGVIDNDSEYTWVIDPIDGTSNFAAGLPHYGVMVGLLEGDKPIAGGIALPAFGEVYVAQRGQGASCNGTKLKISGETQLLSALVAYGIDGHQENPELTRHEVQLLGEIVLGIRNLRSSNSAFDLAMVARGRYGAILNRTSKIWDNVAPQVLIEEAGGMFTTFDGRSMDYSQPLRRTNQNFTVCAAAPALHAQLQAIIHRS